MAQTSKHTFSSSFISAPSSRSVTSQPMYTYNCDFGPPVCHLPLTSYQLQLALAASCTLRSDFGAQGYVSLGAEKELGRWTRKRNGFVPLIPTYLATCPVLPTSWVPSQADERMLGSDPPGQLNALSNNSQEPCGRLSGMAPNSNLPPVSFWRYLHLPNLPDRDCGTYIRSHSALGLLTLLLHQYHRAPLFNPPPPLSRGTTTTTTPTDD